MIKNNKYWPYLHDNTVLADLIVRISEELSNKIDELQTNWEFSFEYITRECINNAYSSMQSVWLFYHFYNIYLSTLMHSDNKYFSAA